MTEPARYSGWRGWLAVWWHCCVWNAPEVRGAAAGVLFHRWMTVKNDETRYDFCECGYNSGTNQCHVDFQRRQRR